MNKNSIEKIKRILFILIPTFGILFIVVLLYNRGFYFSESRNSIEIKITSNIIENKKEVFTKLFNDNEIKIAYSDFDKGELVLQHTAIEKVNELLQGSNEETIIEIREVILNNQNILFSYIFFLIIIFSIFSGLIFYRNIREIGYIKLKDLSKIYLPYAGSIILTQLIFLGSLSVFSRFILIKEISVLPGLFMLIITSILFFLSLDKLEKNNKVDYMVISAKFINLIKSFTIPLGVFSILVFIILIISFGVDSIVLLIPFILSILIFLLITRWINKIFYLNFRLHNLKIKFRHTKIIAEKNSVKEYDLVSKKRNIKTKHKNNKSKPRKKR